MPSIETIIGFVITITTSVLGFYIFVVKKLENFEVKITRIEKDIDLIHGSKIEESLARIEAQIISIEKQIDRLSNKI